MNCFVNYTFRQILYTQIRIIQYNPSQFIGQANSVGNIRSKLLEDSIPVLIGVFLLKQAFVRAIHRFIFHTEIGISNSL